MLCLSTIFQEYLGLDNFVTRMYFTVVYIQYIPVLLIKLVSRDWRVCGVRQGNKVFARGWVAIIYWSKTLYYANCDLRNYTSTALEWLESIFFTTDLFQPQRTSAYLGIHIAENRDCQRFLKGKGYPRRCSVKKPHHDLILSWHWNRAWAHKKGLLRSRFLVPLGKQTTRVSLSCKVSFSWGFLAECQYTGNRGGHLCSGEHLL